MTADQPSKFLGLIRQSPWRVSSPTRFAPQVVRDRNGRRHLIYFVYPVRESNVWAANVEAVKSRIDLFDGIRACMVATMKGEASPFGRFKHTLHAPEVVRDRLAGLDFKMLTMPAHASGESAGFGELMREVSPFRSNRDFTFYAHAKGVTHPAMIESAVHDWTSILYAGNLDYWPIVERWFASGKSCVGCLQQPRPNGSWHYSGGFVWFRNWDVFKHRFWHRSFTKRYSSIELWPARIFPRNEKIDTTGVVFNHRGEDWNAYDRETMFRIMVDFQSWSDENAQFRRGGSSSEPWIDYRRRIGLT
jgi:hypothetical protein